MHFTRGDAARPFGAAVHTHTPGTIFLYLSALQKVFLLKGRSIDGRLRCSWVQHQSPGTVLIQPTNLLHLGTGRSSKVSVQLLRVALLVRDRNANVLFHAVCCIILQVSISTSFL